jgi:hypothetical protein
MLDEYIARWALAREASRRACYGVAREDELVKPMIKSYKAVLQRAASKPVAALVSISAISNPSSP